MAIEIRALRMDEIAEHDRLVYESYLEYVTPDSPGSFLNLPDWWSRNIRCDPYWQPEQTRVLFVDGVMAAGITNYLRHVHVAGRTAKVSAIGSVCTHPDYRRQGHVRRLLGESIEWMEREGFHCSFLFGREAVYGGAGWSCLTAFETIADITVSDHYGHDLTCREVDPDTDAPVLSKLYDAFSGNLCGPFVRNEDYWRNRILSGRVGSSPPPYRIIEDAGKPIAYYFADDTAIREIAWSARECDVAAYIVRRFPARTPVRFAVSHPALTSALQRICAIAGYDAVQKHPGEIKLVECYKGLWRYIGDPQGLFPEIDGTESLKRFLRELHYTFWWVDRF